jgi:hypothetical protein
MTFDVEVVLAGFGGVAHVGTWNPELVGMPVPWPAMPGLKVQKLFE